MKTEDEIASLRAQQIALADRYGALTVERDRYREMAARYELLSCSFRGDLKRMTERAEAAEAALAAERARADRLAEALLGGGRTPSNAEFLRWLGDRLVYSHGEDPNLDFIRACDARAAVIDAALAHPAPASAPAAADDAVRVAERAVIEAARAYREEDANDTPRMWKGKKLHDLAMALDERLEALDALAAQPEAAHDR